MVSFNNKWSLQKFPVSSRTKKSLPNKAIQSLPVVFFTKYGFYFLFRFSRLSKNELLHRHLKQRIVTEIYSWYWNKSLRIILAVFLSLQQSLKWFKNCSKGFSEVFFSNTLQSSGNFVKAFSKWESLSFDNILVVDNFNKAYKICLLFLLGKTCAKNTE